MRFAQRPARRRRWRHQHWHQGAGLPDPVHRRWMDHDCGELARISGVPAGLPSGCRHWLCSQCRPAL